MTTFTGKHQLHRDTAANWTTAGTVLAAGELGYETDTGKFKIGDGTTAWASLAYGSFITDADLASIGQAERGGHNSTVGTLTKSTPVFRAGFDGTSQLPTLDKAQADVAASMPCFGLVKEDIVPSADGVVVRDGPISGLDTSAWTIGDPLYVSTTAGALTNVAPTTGQVQQVAVVDSVNATTGIITVGIKEYGSNAADLAVPAEIIDDADSVISVDVAGAGQPANMVARRTFANIWTWILSKFQAQGDLGAIATGTLTPVQSGGSFQKVINGGAFTLAPPGANGSIALQITNNATAGAITTTGFTKVTGDAFTTVNGDDFMAFITENNGFSHLNVVALQ